MDYMTLKEASKIWGVTPRSGKNGNRLAYPKECYEAIGWAEKICRAIRRRTS